MEILPFAKLLFFIIIFVKPANSKADEMRKNLTNSKGQMTSHINVRQVSLNADADFGNLMSNINTVPCDFFTSLCGCIFDRINRNPPPVDLSTTILEYYKAHLLERKCGEQLYRNDDKITTFVDDQIEFVDRKLNGVGLFWMVLAIIFMALSAFFCIAFGITLFLLIKERQNGFRPNGR